MLPALLGLANVLANRRVAAAAGAAAEDPEDPPVPPLAAVSATLPGNATASASAALPDVPTGTLLVQKTLSGQAPPQRPK